MSSAGGEDSSSSSRKEEEGEGAGESRREEGSEWVGELDLGDLYGAEAGWVEARTSCPHLGTMPPAGAVDLERVPPPDSPCSRCHHPAENWLCLICKDCVVQSFYQQTYVVPLSRNRSLSCFELQGNDLKLGNPCEDILQYPLHFREPSLELQSQLGHFADKHLAN